MLKANFPSYKIDDKEILKDISLHLKDSQNLTILGSNGAGKSTLAKLLCGILKSKNLVSLDGSFIEKLADKKRAKLINYIPPKLSIYDSFITVYDFLALGYHESKIGEVLKLLEIEEFEKTSCSTLSSGEQQLLLVASALVHDAKITIFDEPTSNLDPKKTKKIFDILKSNLLKQKIVITHDLQFAYKLGFPIYYIFEGRAEMFEDVEEFFDKTNLEKLFEGSVEKLGEDVVIKL
jgi:iron complex transport system ATP-binding protein